MKNTMNHLICAFKGNRASSNFSAVKSIIFLLAFLINGQIFLSAQSIGINNDNSPPDASAILDVKSTEKGVLFPRLSNEEMSLIQNPAEGLMIYNLGEKALFVMRDGNWQSTANSSGGYWLSANNGIYYPNKASIGDNTGSAMFNVYNSAASSTGEGLRVSNYYNGGIDKSTAHFYSANSGSGKVNGVKVYTESSTSGDTYGVHSNLVPGSTTGNAYAIYGKIEPIGNTGSGEQWAGYFDGDAYVDKVLKIGNNGAFEAGKLRVMNNEEATSAYISNTFSEDFQSNGLSINLSGNTSHQSGVHSNITPNNEASKTAIGFSSNMGTFFGSSGIAEKTLIGFNASFSSNTLGNKYGIKVSAKGEENWAGYFDGRGIFSEKFFVGDIPQLSYGAANINNNAGNLAALYIESTSALALADFGFYNNFSSNVDGDRNYANYTAVSGGAPSAETFGHFVDMQFASGIRYGYYVNNPGGTNWASYFDGRSYISESLFVGNTVGKSGYRVSVDGKIACEELLVEMSQDWPDYVFKPSYNLLPLDQLEKSIIKEGHLPGIPSANQIEEEGLKVGDMQKRMMEKIEELTLYIIKLSKENEQLSARLNQLENKAK